MRVPKRTLLRWAVVAYWVAFPRTDLARSLITIQLVVDILAAIVLFGLLVGRLASRLGARPDPV